MNARAQTFPVGDYLCDELDARGWSQAHLAGLMGRPTQVINEIINGKKAITTRTAFELDIALGVPAETWLTVQLQWRCAEYRRGRGKSHV